MRFCKYFVLFSAAFSFGIFLGKHNPRPAGSAKPPGDATHTRKRKHTECEFAYPAKLHRLKRTDFDKSECLIDSGASSHIWNCIADVARWRTRKQTKARPAHVAAHAAAVPPRAR